jgi:ABC-type iron transport system FetAB ATPase subunit
MYPDEYEGTLKLVIVGPSGAGKSASELFVLVLHFCVLFWVVIAGGGHAAEKEEWLRVHTGADGLWLRSASEVL